MIRFLLLLGITISYCFANDIFFDEDNQTCELDNSLNIEKEVEKIDHFFHQPKIENNAFKCLAPGRLTCKDKINLLALQNLYEQKSNGKEVKNFSDKVKVLESGLTAYAQNAFIAGKISTALELSKTIEGENTSNQLPSVVSNPLSPERKTSGRIDLLLARINEKCGEHFNQFRDQSTYCIDHFMKKAQERSTLLGYTFGGLSSALKETTGIGAVVSDQEIIDDCMDKINVKEDNLRQSFFDWIDDNKKDLSRDEIKALTTNFAKMTQETNDSVYRSRIAFTQGVTDGSVTFLKGAVAVGATILTAGLIAESLAPATVAENTGAHILRSSMKEIGGKGLTGMLATTALESCISVVGADLLIEGGSETAKKIFRKNGNLSCDKWIELISDYDKGPKTQLGALNSRVLNGCWSGAKMGAFFGAIFKGANNLATFFYGPDKAAHHVTKAGVGLSTGMIFMSGGDAYKSYCRSLDAIKTAKNSHDGDDLNECIDHAKQVALIDSTGALAYDIIETIGSAGISRRMGRNDPNMSNEEHAEYLLRTQMTTKDFDVIGTKDITTYKPENKEYIPSNPDRFYLRKKEEDLYKAKKELINARSEKDQIFLKDYYKQQERKRQELINNRNVEYDQFEESIKHLDLPESMQAEQLLLKKEEFNQHFEREYADYQKKALDDLSSEKKDLVMEINRELKEKESQLAQYYDQKIQDSTLGRGNTKQVDQYQEDFKEAESELRKTMREFKSNPTFMTYKSVLDAHDQVLRKAEDILHFQGVDYKRVKHRDAAFDELSEYIVISPDANNRSPANLFAKKASSTGLELRYQPLNNALESYAGAYSSNKKRMYLPHKYFYNLDRPDRTTRHEARHHYDNMKPESGKYNPFFGDFKAIQPKVESLANHKYGGYNDYIGATELPAQYNDVITYAYELKNIRTGKLKTSTIDALSSLKFRAKTYRQSVMTIDQQTALLQKQLQEDSITIKSDHDSETNVYTYTMTYKLESGKGEARYQVELPDNKKGQMTDKEFILEDLANKKKYTEYNLKRIKVVEAYIEKNYINFINQHPVKDAVLTEALKRKVGKSEGENIDFTMDDLLAYEDYLIQHATRQDGKVVSVNTIKYPLENFIKQRRY